METAAVPAPFGSIRLEHAPDGVIHKIHISKKRTTDTKGESNVVKPFEAYFAGDLAALDAVPTCAVGTIYQQTVWSAMRRIPPGSVTTYGRLAKAIKSGPRAVAGACGANPLPLVVPCHRVVATNGLGGYMGERGIEIKRWLLQHEGAIPA